MRSYTGSPDDDDDDDDDDVLDVLEMRPSSRNYTTTKPSVRSQSKVSTASSSSSTSSASTNTDNSSSTNRSHASTDTTSSAGSLSPSRMNRKPSSSSSSSSTSTARRYSSSTYRPSANTYTTRRGQPPPLIRTPAEHGHVTIAPIPPTILKTTGVWSESFGDEGSDDGSGSWNTKGTWPGQDTSAGNGKKGKGKTVGLYGSFGMGGGSDKEGHSSEGTPVELVYVPPFYSRGDDEEYDGGHLDEDEYKEPDEYQDVISNEAPESAPWDVYHHRTGVTGSAGLSDSNGIYIPSQPSPPVTAPIPIVRSPTPGLPTVLVDDQTTTSALSSSGLVKSRGDSRTGNRQRSSAEEDAYDSFGAPDLGEGYYARRGGQRYDRTGPVPSPSSSATAALGGGFSTTGNERQRERERERRTVIQGGEERQSRSRSRSQSRTPSPAFISSPMSTSPTALVGQVQSGRKRSASASAMPSGSISFSTPSSLTNDLLFPPQRGRQPQSQSQSFSQPQPRGRSSTRATSSSSREGSSIGSSPMGSLSPEGLVRPGGRGKEKAKESEIGRGGERRGRERTSERMSSTIEIESTVKSGHVGSGSSSTTATDRVVTGSSFSSTTSSYSSSTSTVMGPPPSNAISVNISPINEDRKHMAYVRLAEEEQRKEVPPTPSSSPVVAMTTPVLPGAGVSQGQATIDRRDREGSTPSTTPTGITSPSVPPPPSSSRMPSHVGLGHTRSSSYSESVSTALSPSKLRPPPLIPPPPLLAKPSTSFTAVSSPSPASPIINTFNKGLTSPTTPSSGEHSIVGKAVDIVSSAGAFLGLWQHSSISEGQR